MYEKRGWHELVYLKDTAVTSVELPTMWRIDRKRITGQQSHFVSSLIRMPEKAGLSCEATTLRDNLSYRVVPFGLSKTL
jgi:hypothetical protein